MAVRVPLLPGRMLVVALMSFVLLMDTFFARPRHGGGGFMFVAADPSFKEEMSPHLCHYDVLEVSRKADARTLKKAYKKAALYDISLNFPFFSVYGHACV